jgi:hypothetical protein
MSATDILREGAQTYEERNALYADQYKRIGKHMQLMFPSGLPPMDAAGWNRFGVWFMAFNKLGRYAQSLESGGHADSAHDAMVYSAMLEELSDD